MTIWEEQKRHVACIHDKENLPLYSKVSTVKKGHHYLPVYRCARGSNSLESFYSHVVNFIPGKSANAIHFQAFLLDGLSRWNTARKDAVEDLSLVDVRTFDQELTTKFDGLHDKLFGILFFSNISRLQRSTSTLAWSTCSINAVKRLTNNLSPATSMS